jgi:K+ transporter
VLCRTYELLFSRCKGKWPALTELTSILSKLELTKGKAPNMARWRKQLFIATSYITADAADYFGLPPIARWSWVHGLRFS